MHDAAGLDRRERCVARRLRAHRVEHEIRRTRVGCPAIARVVSRATDLPLDGRAAQRIGFGDGDLDAPVVLASNAASMPIAPPPMTSIEHSGSGRCKRAHRQVQGMQRRCRRFGQRRMHGIHVLRHVDQASARHGHELRKRARPTHADHGAIRCKGCCGPARSSRRSPQVISGLAGHTLAGLRARRRSSPRVHVRESCGGMRRGS